MLGVERFLQYGQPETQLIDLFEGFLFFMAGGCCRIDIVERKSVPRPNDHDRAFLLPLFLLFFLAQPGSGYRPQPGAATLLPSCKTTSTPVKRSGNNPECEQQPREFCPRQCSWR